MYVKRAFENIKQVAMVSAPLDRVTSNTAILFTWTFQFSLKNFENMDVKQYLIYGS